MLRNTKKEVNGVDYIDYFEYQTNIHWDEFSSERDYYSQDPRREINKEFWTECEEIPF